MNEDLVIQKIHKLKLWTEKEAKFHSRTDTDFLLVFLRSCDFDISLTKKKLALYYQNRIKYPYWWANRNVHNLRQIINLRSMTTLIEKNTDLPTVVITRLRCFGPDSTIFNDLAKLSTIGFEMLVRRPNCQNNGFVIINDCLDYPSWFAFQLLWPSTLKNIINSFFHAMPINMKKFIFINTPSIASYVHGLCHPFLGQIRDKIHFVGSDLSKLAELVALETLPEEYGGPAGTFDQHHDSFLNEVLEFNDYLIEDEKYGFLSSSETK